MRMRWPAIVALFPALLLAACATTALYQARDGESGYAETQLSQNTWRVEFVGDEFTSRDTVETYLLYRAAELTADRGYEWFAMPGRAVGEETEIIVEAERPQAYRARYWQPKWRRRSRFFWSDIDPVGPMPHEMHESESPRIMNNLHYSTSANIVMGNGPPPVGGFVALETIARLETSIVRPHT